jgi:hypothetical protein
MATGMLLISLSDFAIEDGGTWIIGGGFTVLVGTGCETCMAAFSAFSVGALTIGSIVFSSDSFGIPGIASGGVTTIGSGVGTAAVVAATGEDTLGSALGSVWRARETSPPNVRTELIERFLVELITE